MTEFLLINAVGIIFLFLAYVAAVFAGTTLAGLIAFIKGRLKAR